MSTDEYDTFEGFKVPKDYFSKLEQVLVQKIQGQPSVKEDTPKRIINIVNRIEKFFARFNGIIPWTPKNPWVYFDLPIRLIATLVFGYFIVQHFLSKRAMNTLIADQNKEISITLDELQLSIFEIEDLIIKMPADDENVDHFVALFSSLEEDDQLNDLHMEEVFSDDAFIADDLLFDESMNN